jgi:hypothetical protein
MCVKRILSVFVLLAIFFAYTTYDLQAAAIQTPTVSHAISSQELHQAVQASDQKANEARKAVRDFLTRPDLAAQISSVGLRPGEIAARIQMLNDAEVLLIQQQIMKENLQAETAAGLTRAGKVMTIVGIALAAAGAIAVFANWDTPLWEGSVESYSSAAWKGAGLLLIGVGAVLTVVGLTRRD